jgi:hydroxyacylglutathione hydrolase
MKIVGFTFNPFQENTWLAIDPSGDCAIIDPGCYDREEQSLLEGYISENSLKPVLLLNTHCHIDHVFGNRFIYDRYGLKPQIHRLEIPVLESVETVGKLYGVNVEKSPEPAGFLEEGDVVTLGKEELEVIFTPGHSPGSICFLYRKDKVGIGGDVLFYGSIGRTDLPGGDHQTLLRSIREKLFPLGDAWRILPGHGPETTIGFEKLHNPFLT